MKSYYMLFSSDQSIFLWTYWIFYYLRNIILIVLSLFIITGIAVYKRNFLNVIMNYKMKVKMIIFVLISLLFVVVIYTLIFYKYYADEVVFSVPFL